MREILSFNVVRQSGSAMLWQVVGLGLAYGVHIALARWMGAVEYGRYSYVVIWVALIATPVGLGLPLLLVRFVAEYQVHNAWSKLRGLLQWGAGSTLLLGGVVAGVIVAGLQGTDMVSLRQYTYALGIGLWLVPAQALFNFIGGAFRGLHRVGWQYAIVPARHGLLLAGVAFWYGWSHHLTSTHVLVLMLVVALVLLMGLSVIGIRLLPRSARKAEALYTPKAWLRISLPLMMVGLFALLMSQTDILVVGTLLGPYEAGLYRAASRTASLVALGPIAIGAAIDPVLVTLYAEGKTKRLQQIASRMVRWTVGLSGLASLGLIIASKPVLALFGKDFVAAQSILIVLVAGQLVYAASGMAAGLLNLTGHQHWGMGVFGASAVLNIGLSLGGVMLWGSLGAAWATCTTTAFLSLALWWQARKRVDIDASVLYALLVKESRQDGE